MEETIKLQGKDGFNYRAEKMNECDKSPIYCNVMAILYSGIENLIRNIFFIYSYCEKYNI